MLLLWLKKMKMGKSGLPIIMIRMIFAVMMMIFAEAADTNPVYSPCLDAKVSKWDGFTFGLAFSTKESFSMNQTQLSPCDIRLPLPGSNAQLAVFRPKVDEMTLISIENTAFTPVTSHMVAFAGRQYAARSIPIMVYDNTHTVTKYTLVLEFQHGTLQNLFWKSFGCDSCSRDSICLNNQDCAVPNSKCRSNGGPVDCTLAIQLTFSGTDKNLQALNSWFELKNFRKHSLYGLYSGVFGSLPHLPNGKAFRKL
ncbi:hypothetical protein EZV62_011568 [Acer yangbiense]|uniref:Uncharacterized protein n=1 Tax=Acer yangbiense TaxID=1000413 RepID=A0A5C7I629_9ROSI|nr:hypothetical protein EZV62_011568 [Acer yangbiense]